MRYDLKDSWENYHPDNSEIPTSYISTMTFDNNKEDLLRLLQFSKYWDKIFVNYLSYAHEYRRHAGENRHDLKHEIKRLINNTAANMGFCNIGA